MHFFSLIVTMGLLVHPDTLQSSVLVADKGLAVSKTDTLTTHTGASLTEIIQQSTILFVGETGGPAGQKNVSLRGLGSAHTAIYIDGVRVGNVQSGQGDLTNLGAEQFASAVIDYAQNSVYFSTAKPRFESGRSVSGQASLAAGSFGTWNPYGRVDFKLGKSTSLSASAAGLVSRGDFTYGDSLTRKNNDIRQISAGIDAFGRMNGGNWHAKMHYSGSERGLPGSVNWPSTDRQIDRNAYVQGSIEERCSGIYSISASAKYSFDRMDYLSEWGDSRYDQNEAQVHIANKISAKEWLSLSLAAGFVWDRLASNAYNAERYSPTASIGAAFRTGRFRADIALKYDGAIDKDGLSRNTLSPSADIRFSILRGLEISAFGRRGFRVPTFNELYYQGYGNPELKPEDAFMSGVGIAFGNKLGDWKLRVSADGFLNLLTDKIVSAPTEADPSIWLPYNIGNVRSIGADITAGFEYTHGFRGAGLQARYSYQSATDITPGSANYGEQIPYIAKHSVQINASASFRTWKINAVWNLRSGLRDGSGDAPDWNTLDITLSKDIKFKGCGPLTLFIKGKNLSDCRYESVSGYPMPGRSVTGGINFKF